MKVASRRTGNRRLKKLADFLLTIPRKKFDLAIIAKSGDHGRFPSKTECGSAACAIGWSPNVFPKDCTYIVANHYDRNCHVMSLEDNDVENFDFAEKFFGLNMIESMYLFHPYNYPRNRRGSVSVAKRIKSFIKHRPSKEEMEIEYNG